MSALAILEQRHRIDWDAAVRYILQCQNFDGGFGCVPGSESHAGQGPVLGLMVCTVDPF